MILGVVLTGGATPVPLPVLTENTVTTSILTVGSIMVAVITTFGVIFAQNSNKARSAAESANTQAQNAYKQLQNNGGSTVKDSQDRTELMIRGLVKEFASQMTQVNDKLDRDHRAISRLNTQQTAQDARLDAHIEASERVVRALSGKKQKEEKD